jgi:RHS repeat-associated protein
MDNFTYNYLNIGSALSNRLGHVSDAVNASVNTDDIESQNANNYTYDQLGQLISDQQEMIASIEWRSGDKKIKTLTRAANAGNKSDLEFIYNPLGQRILKIEKPRVNNVLQTRNWWKYTYYTYDANGQVMATYEVTLSTALNRAYLKDQNIYGASRLGMRNKYIALYENGTVPYTIPAVQQNTLGDVAYEITNYLGNVNVVISDRKIWVTNAFKACNLSRTDYFPFGMEISSRTTNSDNYRFGYTGKVDDKEISGNGNSYDFGNRQYDPRIGRWLSLDPLKAMYPSMSPFCYAGNTPIVAKDPDGRLIIFVNGFTGGIYPYAKYLGLPYSWLIDVEGAPSGKDYWGKSGDFQIGAQAFFGGDRIDENTSYIDGSVGVWGLSTAQERYDAGVQYAKDHIEEIKASLLNPNEEINFVSHSMGSAYSEGIMAYLGQQGLNVKSAVHLSACDAADIKVYNQNVMRYQIGVDRDFTLFGFFGADKYSFGSSRIIPGADKYGEIRANQSMISWKKDFNEQKKSFEKYDFHAFTKTHFVWSSVEELRSSDFQRTKVYQYQCITFAEYSLKNASKFKWNSFKDGCNGYLEDKNCNGNTYIHEYDGCD